MSKSLKAGPVPVTLAEHVNKYKAVDSIAWRRVAIMAVQHVATFMLYNYIPVPLFVLSHALLMLQAFTIFHDCGHGSFFTTPAMNKSMEWFTSCFLMTPVDWSIRHAIHHGRSGNLATAASEWNDTIWITKKEYLELPEDRRKMFRFFRQPILFFLVGPFLLWEVQYRIPWLKLNPANDGDDRPEVFNSLVNTLTNGLYLAFVYKTWGSGAFWWYCLAIYLGEMFGLFLFHSQHSFNPSYTVREGWNRKDSALKGSSFQSIPAIFKWWFMGIEYHHIHHYTTKVPGYMLQKCHEEAPPGMWDDITVLSYMDMIKGTKYTLYDEENNKYISFDEVDENTVANKAKQT